MATKANLQYNATIVAVFSTFIAAAEKHAASEAESAVKALAQACKLKGDGDVIKELRVARRENTFANGTISMMENVARGLRDGEIKVSQLQPRKLKNGAIRWPSLRALYEKTTKGQGDNTGGRPKGTATAKGTDKAEAPKLSQNRLIEMVTATCAKSPRFQAMLLKALQEIGAILSDEEMAETETE